MRKYSKWQCDYIIICTFKAETMKTMQNLFGTSLVAQWFKTASPQDGAWVPALC